MNEHLIRNIPNNPTTRALIKRINKFMRTSDSKYRLDIRYRHPIVPQKRSTMSIPKSNAKSFSVYLKKRDIKPKYEEVCQNCDGIVMTDGTLMAYYCPNCGYDLVAPCVSCIEKGEFDCNFCPFM